jgi:NCAIR mutase (PurE)-related protein
MDSVKDLLQQLLAGTKSIDEVESQLKSYYIAHIDDMVQLDIFRHQRTGIPEVIFAETKATSIILEIADRMLTSNKFVLITRCKNEDLNHLRQKYGKNPDIVSEFNDRARTVFLHTKEFQITQKSGLVGIITAGTSDIPVAEEARMVLHVMGINVTTTYDVGIAGIHRLFPPLQEMIKNKVDVLIVIAGMEGTLPGVITALVDTPVIGVPTSTGYGLGEKGVGALTTMLQSCSPGLAVVNIDNGFGAAAMAAIILKKIYKN